MAQMVGNVFDAAKVGVTGLLKASSYTNPAFRDLAEKLVDDVLAAQRRFIEMSAMLDLDDESRNIYRGLVAATIASMLATILPRVFEQDDEKKRTEFVAGFFAAILSDMMPFLASIKCKDNKGATNV